MSLSDYQVKIGQELRLIEVVQGRGGQHLYITRRVCICGTKEWGAACHAKNCPVYLFHACGHAYALGVLKRLAPWVDFWPQ